MNSGNHCEAVFSLQKFTVQPARTKTKHLHRRCNLKIAKRAQKSENTSLQTNEANIVTVTSIMTREQAIN